MVVVDRDVNRIQAWKSDTLPVLEPFLHDTMRPVRDGFHPRPLRNLDFTTDMEASICAADMIMVAVDTPTKSRGTGSGHSLDIGRLEEVAMSIASFAQSNKIVVEKSTVPVGTGEAIRKILNNNAQPGVEFEVLSNPEFLAEGTAVENLLFPDRVLIGSMDTERGRIAAQALADVYATWVPRSKIISMNLFSAELSKLATNAMLAQRISSMNALSVICEATGADATQLSQAVGSDSRIGPHMLQPSFGFGGSCFKKDILCLIYLCKCLHLDYVAAYWQGILDVNERQKSRTIERIASHLNNSMGNKKIAVLGFAFKEGTADTRESCAIDLIKGLLREGSSVAIYDPCVEKSQIYQDLGIDELGNSDFNCALRICSSGEEACDSAHAVIVATNWDIFQTNPTSTDESIASGRIHTHIDERPVHSPSDTTQHKSSMSHGPAGPNDDAVFLNSSDGSKSNGNQSLVGLTEECTPRRRLDWDAVAKSMRYPKIVFGSSTCLNKDVLERLGFDVELIGRGKTLHA